MFSLRLTFAGGWLGLDLTREVRRGLARGKRQLVVEGLEPGRAGGKWAFLQTRAAAGDKVRTRVLQAKYG